MGETSKRRADREALGYFTKYLTGFGIDIGCGDDPVTPDCDRWDLPQGDAQFMAGVPDEKYDWVYSSHCLEHMVDPGTALQNWWRILKPGGYLIVLVPDEDLYEQGFWPPHHNTDHKTTWTIHKDTSWSPVSRNLKDELAALPNSRVRHIYRHESGYDYTLQGKVKVSLLVDNPETLGKSIEGAMELRPEMLHGPMRHLGFFPIDQTSSPMTAEVSIEGIVQKVL